MKPTFHIIEKIHANLLYDVVVIDNYGNFIHIPKHLIVNRGLIINETKTLINRNDYPENRKKFRADVSIDGLDLPFIVLAYFKKYKKVTTYKSIERKKLVASTIFAKTSQLIGVYANNILLEINGNTANNDVNYHLECIKDISVEFENYIQNKTVDKKQFKFHSPEEYLMEEDGDKLEWTRLIGVRQDSKVFPWINFLNLIDFDILLFKNGIFSRDINGEINSPNCLEIRLIPLFCRRIYFEWENNIASKKIITPDQFKLFDQTLDFFIYIQQFYNLADSNYCKITNQTRHYMVKYEREYYSEYTKRLHDKFNTHFVYAIQPYWHDDLSKDALESLHNDIIEVSNVLVNSGITNLIINPPINDIDNWIQEEEDYYETLGDDQAKRESEMFEEHGNQEMRAMDEETGGAWRIENDLD